MDAVATDELRLLFQLTRGKDLPGIAERARSVLDTSDHTLRAAARALVGMPDAVGSTPREGEPFVEPVTDMAFVWVPSGRFVMGSSKQPGQLNYDPEAYNEELPAHPVQLTGFWISVYPVTNEQYGRFIAETRRAAPSGFENRQFNDPAQPVVTVSWHEAWAFTSWLTIPFGVQDLAGNVWEWCLDAWAPSYVEIQAERADPCRHDDARGGGRVVRGGCWNVQAWYLRSAYRLGVRPQSRLQGLGVRVVCGGARQPDAP